MTHIGGFFELEPRVTAGAAVHENALALSTGRAAMMEMLSEIAPKRVYAPYYTCDAAIEPMRIQGIDVRRYAIDENLRPRDLPDFEAGDYLLYTNYFGLSEQPLQALLREYPGSVLVDDTHGFFRGARPGIWSFTSARKYFGVPDGAFLFSPEPLHRSLPEFDGISLEHLRLRAAGQQTAAFAAYQAYESGLDSRVYAISRFSTERLAAVDYRAVAERRRANFKYLHAELSRDNRLHLVLDDCVPFCYPYLPTTGIPREVFYEQHIYPPCLWPDVLREASPRWEQELASGMLALPIDHRYGESDMQQILEVIRSH